ncbi:hypothetical protein MGM1_1230 [Candidatus Malacoplasma girerdii]|uniref:Uncharacterized protein n=1 Tax=Candidatus Malacoplasma girerdii TaxID=1318617 RepID=A0A097SSF1_9BACT|nr:hypothetical protein MGM1_1230 [Candidatus Malacoplasma girerdii]
MIKLITNIVQMRIQLTERIPWSKLDFLVLLVSNFATFPKIVFFPVFTTTPIAVPEETEVPIKQRLLQSNALFVFSLIGVANFSTGSLSPVNDDWVMNKSLADKILISAGIMSPAANLIISPGSTSSIGISLVWPLRIIAVVVLIISFNFSLALELFRSWNNLIIPEIRIMLIIRPKLIHWPNSILVRSIIGVKIFNKAITINTTEKGFKKASTKTLYQWSFFLVAMVFKPYFSLKSSICSNFNPSFEVSKDLSTSFTSFLAYTKNWSFCVLVILLVILLVFKKPLVVALFFLAIILWYKSTQT